MTITFGNIMWTLTASLQLTGAILLLENVKRVKPMLLSSSSALTGIINDDGSFVADNISTELIKKRLQNFYINWIAFIALVLGYTVSYWSEANTQATWIFALASIIITLLLITVIKRATKTIAEKYKTFYNSFESKDIPPGTVCYKVNENILPVKPKD